MATWGQLGGTGAEAEGASKFNERDAATIARVEKVKPMIIDVQ